MPYLKSASVDVLTLPSDQAYSVSMKSRASYGDVESARSAMLKITGSAAGVSQDVQWKAYIMALILSLITDWNLTDEQDQKLSITAINLAKLDPIDGDFLAAEAQKRSALRPEVREVPFESTSTNS